MLWNREDLNQYKEAKEYIDTLLIPLIPFTFEDDEELSKKAYQGEVVRIFTQEIEKEFKGRIVLTPDYYYLSKLFKEEINRLSDWIENMKTQPFEHIFFFTFDSRWRKYEKEMDGTVIWLPGMASGEESREETQKAVKSQLSDIKEFIRSYWS